MKRILELLSTGILLLTVVGCRDNGPLNDMEASVVLTPLQQTTRVDDISSLVEDIQLVKIADDERTYMSTAAKMLLDKSGNIYVLDDRNNLVAMKPDGTYHSTIARQGRAGNEYLNIRDIALSDDEFLILDGTKVKCFNLLDSSHYRIIAFSIFP